MKRFTSVVFASVFAIGALLGCKNASDSDDSPDDKKPPVDVPADPDPIPITDPPVVVVPVISFVTPDDQTIGAMLKTVVTAGFSADMDAATLTGDTFYVSAGDAKIPGSIGYYNRVATFVPEENLLANTVYTATLTTGVRDVATTAIAMGKVWSFATRLGPADVDFGTAGCFVILAEAGIDSIPTSVITGNIGVSPASSTYLTHFSLTLDPTGVFSKSGQVVGNVYASDYALETPARLTTAVDDMMLADIDVSGRLNPDFVNLETGNIGGKTLSPGLYAWDSGVSIMSDLTLAGGENDVWIFQVPGVLYMGSGAKVLLTGGARAKNITWKVNSATLNSNAHFEGTLLTNTSISFARGASANGRLFAHTAVTLDACAVTEP